MAYWTAKGVMPRWSLVAVYVLVTLVFVVTANWSHDAASKATVAARQAGVLAQRLDRDAKARVQESCLTSKRRYLTAVTSLTRTYSFLEQSSLQERKSTINRFVTAGLDKQEKDVESLRPASFCRGIGPETPPIPQRPQSLRSRR